MWRRAYLLVTPRDGKIAVLAKSRAICARTRCGTRLATWRSLARAQPVQVRSPAPEAAVILKNSRSWQVDAHEPEMI